MSKTVIKIENLSKIYRLGEVGTGTLSHDLNRWVRMNILGQDDPYAKVGHVNDRTQKAEKGELVAALRDINLEVKEGEVLGIIGKNGAGKSTLLKLLSRVTSPTTGSIKVNGRLASLLEVGTGFHPEMTGRENIYMNGTIMGMRKWEIDRKLEEIIDFAGVAKYLDTPTKRYSSGMTVRLGFAIAAHLEPEILVVDEVLAVGDAEFQKKAIGKMQDVSHNQGRTVLFVSHNMGAVSKLCTKGVLLQNGKLNFTGNINETINAYIHTRKTDTIYSAKNENAVIKKFYLESEGASINEVRFNKSISLVWEIDPATIDINSVVSYQILNKDETVLFADLYPLNNKLKENNNTIKVSTVIPAKTLLPNDYLINTSVHAPNVKMYEQLKDKIGFRIIDTGSPLNSMFKSSLGYLNILSSWS
nr:ABC transporter ATP-binding protein [uncultured Carboxylicivirga sp.]